VTDKWWSMSSNGGRASKHRPGLPWLCLVAFAQSCRAPTESSSESSSPLAKEIVSGPSAPEVEADRDGEIVAAALRDLLAYSGDDSPVAIHGSAPVELLVDPRPCRWALQEWDIFHDRHDDIFASLTEGERIGAHEAVGEICRRIGASGEPFFLEAPDARIRLVDPEGLDTRSGRRLPPFERPISAWHPGRAGRFAVVCLHVPWSIHGALGNFLLVEEQGSWRVRLRQFVYYL
jgi:hypothetical protein